MRNDAYIYGYLISSLSGSACLKDEGPRPKEDDDVHEQLKTRLSDPHAQVEQVGAFVAYLPCHPADGDERLSSSQFIYTTEKCLVEIYVLWSKRTTRLAPVSFFNNSMLSG